MFGIKELLIILVVVILLFGTKKLRSLGSDLGSSVKGFKKAMEDDADDKKIEDQPGEKNAEGIEEKKAADEHK